ncbi:MAG: thioredoxin family protein, partial [Methyloligellaceae bacterium]
MFIINKSGKLVYKGAIDNRPSANPGDVEGAENYVRSALTALEQGQPVKKSVTRPYGCSVKYGS